MEKYIPKSAVVAEIERIKKEECPTDSYEGRCKLLWFEQFLSFLDTLEVKETKEVDLDESARHYLLHEHISPLNEVLHQADLKVEMQYHKDIEDAYKAGFELGLKAKDVNEIIKTAEDHAYFAGSENTREKLIGKACEWWEKELSYPSMPQKELKWGKCKVKEFRKAMEG